MKMNVTSLPMTNGYRWLRCFSTCWFVATLCLGGSAFAACVNVKTFGATGNGVTDDTAAIQAAINSTKGLPAPAVCFPAGRYRLTQALRPEIDSLTLQGPGATLIADPDMNGMGQTVPEAILVDNGFPNQPISPTNGLTIRGLAFEVRNGFPAGWPISAAVIQLNDCVGCLVTGVSVTYTGSTNQIPGQLDGIATSQGTTGSIEKSVVTGIPKAGIYLAGGTHDLTVTQCEVKNAVGPIAQEGFAISGAQRVSITNSTAHNNNGPGLFIAVQAGGPTSDVTVSNSQFSNNGLGGVWLASTVDGSVPTNVKLANVQALNNASDGILVEAGQNVSIDSPVVSGSGIAGIWFVNSPIGPSFLPRTTSVQVTNPNVSDNGLQVAVQVPGIALQGVQGATITGGQIFHTNPASTQVFGIGLYETSANVASNGVQIIGTVATAGLQLPPIVTINAYGFSDPGAAVQNGYYNVPGLGSPVGLMAAPMGSVYLDVNTGLGYSKASGYETDGWVAM
jgi:hypothetical protein